MSQGIRIESFNPLNARIFRIGSFHSIKKIINRDDFKNLAEIYVEYEVDFNKELNEPNFIPKLNSNMIWRDSESFLPNELNTESKCFKTLEGLLVDILATQSNLHVFLQDIKITLIELIHSDVS